VDDSYSIKNSLSPKSITSRSFMQRYEFPAIDNTTFMVVSTVSPGAVDVSDVTTFVLSSDRDSPKRSPPFHTCLSKHSPWRERKSGR
jgi:hypothetical protein